MLKQIGVATVDDLFSDVPKDLLLQQELDIPETLSESEVLRHVESLLGRNKTFPESLCFLGGGVWPHYVPAAVDEISSRSEFYTSYTPYQPEISQGILQSLFEYQSLICDLTGMDVANSSLYDWATGVGEAGRMAVRVSRRKKMLVSRNVGPERLAVLKTYCEPVNIEVEEVRFDPNTSQTDMQELSDKLSDEIAGVYIENPNFFGSLEEKVPSIADEVHRHGALLIVGVDPISLGVIRPPGDYGADIVVGEGQPLGLHLNGGGPLIGLFAIGNDPTLVREMPGRLIGSTTSLDGEKQGYTMVMQTREQHIRRENATSNICTNEALLAVRIAVYLSLLGPSGIKKLGESVLSNSHYASKLLSRIQGVDSPHFKSTFFKDFTVAVDASLDPEEIYSDLQKEGILGGLPLKRYYKDMPNALLFTVTELHTTSDIEMLAEKLEKVLSG